MVFTDMLKHQSICGISNKFTNSIRKKYNNKITVGEYIIERLVSKNIDIGFGCKGGIYTPFYHYINKSDDFKVVFDRYESTSAYCAINYYKNTDNIGLIISTSTHGFADICRSLNYAQYYNIPLLLMSFYDFESELKIGREMRFERNYLKNYYQSNKSNGFPNLLEYMLTISELPQKGPVHLNICNNIVDDTVNFDNIVLEEK